MYMLDTNTVSHFFRQHPTVTSAITAVPPSQLCISCITEAELLFGVAKRQNQSLKTFVLAFINTVKVYGWDSQAAHVYGSLRAKMEKTGRIMGAFDLLIAAHALSRDTMLVTNDAAFSMVDDLLLTDWTK